MRKKNAVFNLLSGLFLHAVSIISGIIIPRLILVHYGSTINGVNNSIGQFLSYVALVEMGIGNATIVKLYDPIVASDYSSVSDIISSTRKKYLQAGTLYSAIVILLAFIYPYIIRNQIDYKLASLLFLILGINGALDFLLIGKYKALLIAAQKYYIYNLFHALAVVFVMIFSLMCIIAGYSIIAVKAILIVIHIVEAAALSLYCHKKYPQINYKKRGNITFEQQKGSTIIQLAAVITYNTDMITLTLFAGSNSLIEVSVYSTYMLTYSVIVNLLLVITNAVFPGFGEIIANKENDTLKKEFDLYECIYQTILAVIYSVYAFAFLPFIQIYTLGVKDGNYIRIGSMVLFWLAAYTAQVKDSSNILVSSAGRFNETKKYYVYEALINITLSLLLVHQFGISGVLIGTVLSHIMLNACIIRYVSREIVGNPLRKTYFRVGRNFLLIMILFLFENKYIPMIRDVKTWIIMVSFIFLINGGLIFVVNIVIEKIANHSRNLH